MRFRTELMVNKSPWSIRHKDAVILLGSCFADNIGHRLSQHKFNSLANPLGTTFNPVSLAKLIRRICANGKVSPDELQQANGLYFHHDFHTTWNHPDGNTLIQNLNEALSMTKSHIEKSKAVFITLGTAWVYKLRETQQIVSNCHKRPQALFDKIILTPENIDENLHQLINGLRGLNPTVNIVFTLSPVRHLKDGMEANQRSKAVLLNGIYQAMTSSNNVSYFPAYEIVMDDLRDYRFYQGELIHLNDQAINYLWQKFASAYFTDEILKLNDWIESINAFLNHRPYFKDEAWLSHKNKMAALAKSIGPLIQGGWPELE
ncbi:MAG: GSCFA domain-containing protein [Saprospiraceae bacterium]|nr:GSCFA domain-containing protein [Saprospiraceae bacterium]